MATILTVFGHDNGCFLRALLGITIDNMESFWIRNEFPNTPIKFWIGLRFLNMRDFSQGKNPYIKKLKEAFTPFEDAPSAHICYNSRMDGVQEVKDGKALVFTQVLWQKKKYIYHKVCIVFLL